MAGGIKPRNATPAAGSAGPAHSPRMKRLANYTAIRIYQLQGGSYFGTFRRMKDLPLKCKIEGATPAFIFLLVLYGTLLIISNTTLLLSRGIPCIVSRTLHMNLK